MLPLRSSSSHTWELQTDIVLAKVAKYIRGYSRKETMMTKLIFIFYYFFFMGVSGWLSWTLDHGVVSLSPTLGVEVT